ncbi:hypothetical protein BDP27DRAFT_1444420 [Rhodocollybia butyracea]|uniref:Uncharacterized protein n=1 Tax=Rhodocollybia butyracea TaxID=206335 RepID=A0A9P5UDE3_9AGAR|nr:hypothetical protein BDP27DRAFT_1444420 [Rhodocollybia butyracea]
MASRPAHTLERQSCDASLELALGARVCDGSLFTEEYRHSSPNVECMLEMKTNSATAYLPLIVVPSSSFSPYPSPPYTASSSASSPRTTVKLQNIFNRPVELLTNLLRVLLTHGAGPNHQNCYGGTALIPAFMRSYVTGIDVLIGLDADLDITKAGTITPRKVRAMCGP